MIIDSNIIIYSIQPENNYIREFLSKHSISVSVMTYIEVLGYHLITEEEKYYFEKFFNLINIIPLNSEIVDAAINIKQTKKITLADSIIAATALISKKTLITRNTQDFYWIDSLKISDIY